MNKRVDKATIEYAKKLVLANQLASTSMLQRKMKIGYNAANFIMNRLEELGVVGPFNGAKPRKILIEADDKD